MKSNLAYIVVQLGNDYDCGSPYCVIVGGEVYPTWQDAYDAMVKDILKTYGVKSLDEIEYDHDVPSRDKVGRYTHKCGTAWVQDDDGEMIWDIRQIKGLA